MDDDWLAAARTPYPERLRERHGRGIDSAQGAHGHPDLSSPGNVEPATRCWIVLASIGFQRGGVAGRRIRLSAAKVALIKTSGRLMQLGNIQWPRKLITRGKEDARAPCAADSMAPCRPAQRRHLESHCRELRSDQVCHAFPKPMPARFCGRRRQPWGACPKPASLTPDSSAPNGPVPRSLQASARLPTLRRGDRGKVARQRVLPLNLCHR